MSPVLALVLALALAWLLACSAHPRSRRLRQRGVRQPGREKRRRDSRARDRLRERRVCQLIMKPPFCVCYACVSVIRARYGSSPALLGPSQLRRVGRANDIRPGPRPAP